MQAQLLNLARQTIGPSLRTEHSRIKMTLVSTGCHCHEEAEVDAYRLMFGLANVDEIEQKWGVSLEQNQPHRPTRRNPNRRTPTPVHLPKHKWRRLDD